MDILSFEQIVIYAKRLSHGAAGFLYCFLNAMQVTYIIKSANSDVNETTYSNISGEKMSTKSPKWDYYRWK